MTRLALALLTTLALAGCAGTYRVDNAVQSYAHWSADIPTGAQAPAAVPQAPQTYRFERLPSQREGGSAEDQNRLEAWTRTVLETHGWTVAEAPANAPWRVQVTATTVRNARSPWDLDLALSIVRSCSPTLAALAARYLLVEARGSQAEFMIPDHLAHADPVVERFESWARQRLAHGFSLAQAAVATGTSERTLARRLQGVLGRSPLSYFQDLRVERAVHLLRTSTDSVDQIAAQIGYSDGVTLRALLRRKLGRGVRELRAGG